MYELLLDPQAYVSLAVLTLMETVLGIDNIVFITILCGRLPAADQLRARRQGLLVALASRLVLLSGITFIMRLTEPLFFLFIEWTGKDLILFAGGVFLVYKATHEIYVNVERLDEEVEGHAGVAGSKPASLGAIMFQIVVLDVVFSLDSVITAVGMAEHITIMAAAMLISVAIMATFAGSIGDFIQAHPSVRVLALAFLLLIGVMLVLEGTGRDVPKAYIYSAMGFSLLVELLNLRRRTKDRASRRG